jgi:two-component system, NtrC family, response regulator AtoC
MEVRAITVEHLQADHDVEVAPRGQPPEFVSASSAMDAVWRMVDRVAATDVPVLIRGESGVGKDVVARTIHARSPRHARPFLKINCAALPANLLESELFGYQRGAFTGAQQDTKGKFELASEGTLFLDEIGEMPPEMQAKLLQVLQDGEYFRVGGTRAIRVNTRVVVATNRDLEAEIARGGFRGDLYYRLNVVSVRVPALRERPDDIPHLVEHFMQKYARRYDSGMDVVPDDVLELLLRYSWPGNVRELENLVRRMVVLGDARCIVPELTAQRATPAPDAPSTGGVVVAGTQLAPALAHGRDISVGEALERLGIGGLAEMDTIALKDVAHRAQVAAEREAISHILRKCAWNKRKAALRLQISYKALLYKIKECGIVDPRIEQSLPEEAGDAAVA